MKYISVEYILKLHEKMINTTGGSHGIRDINLLKSAIENSKATFDGQDLYPEIQDKCANICFNIINNHPFVDCNKRTGLYGVTLDELMYGTNENSDVKMFARAFSDLSEDDKKEIINLMEFKKKIKESKVLNV